MKDKISEKIKKKIAEIKAGHQEPQSDYVRERLEKIKRKIKSLG